MKPEEQIRVLLVDDQAIVGEIVQQMLAKRDDIVFKFCQEPQKALKTAVEFKPTIILQDLVMPEINGMMLVKIYRANSTLRNVPIMVLSSKYEPAIKVKAFSAGANDYFEKRFDIQDIEKELIARIEYHSKAYLTLLERNNAYNEIERAKKSLDREIDKAAKYVHSILPKEESTEKLTTNWKHQPSTSLSGDAFDYKWLDSDNFACYILDVCGHGVGSALLSVSAINVIRSQALTIDDLKSPAEVFKYLNSRFQMAEQDDLYFTIWYGVYNTKTKKLTYAGAGHPPALLVVNNEIKDLSSNNFIVGGLPEFDFTQDVVEISGPSDLILFTDGAYEIMKPDGTMWEFDEFKDYVKKHNSDSILDDLYEHIQELGGRKKLEDDYTILKISIP